MSASTEFRLGDTRYNLVAKFYRRIGGTPRPADTEEGLWRKIVNAFGGASKPADTIFDSLLKLLRIVDPSHFCTCGDLDYDLLRAILVQMGGTPKLGDTEFDLIREMLAQAEENFFLLESGEGLLLSNGITYLLLNAV